MIQVQETDRKTDWREWFTGKLSLVLLLSHYPHHHTSWLMHLIKSIHICSTPALGDCIPLVVCTLNQLIKLYRVGQRQGSPKQFIQCTIYDHNIEIILFMWHADYCTFNHVPFIRDRDRDNKTPVAMTKPSASCKHNRSKRGKVKGTSDQFSP